MQPTIERAYELVLRQGVFAWDCCDKCGRLLGAVRFTRGMRLVSGAAGSAGETLSE
jgi:hypothetical protein